MDLIKNIKEKTVAINNKGMIIIPSAFRKIYSLKDGDKVLIIEDEAALKIITLKDENNLRKNSYSAEEMLNQMEKSKKEEIKREM